MVSDTYKSDYIKCLENDVLYLMEKGKKEKDNDELKVHFDGKVNYAIGYGLDLAVNDWDTIKKYLDEAEKKSGKKFDYDKLKKINYVNYEVHEIDGEKIEINHEIVNQEYSFKTILEKYKKEVVSEKNDETIELFRYIANQHRTNKEFEMGKNLKIGTDKKFDEYSKIKGKEYSIENNQKVYLKVKNWYENLIKPITSFTLPDFDYLGELFNVMYPKYEELTKNRIPDQYDKLHDCQKYALTSMVFNAGEKIIGDNLKNCLKEYIKYKEKAEKTDADKKNEQYYRTLCWAEIRFASNSSKDSSLALRRDRESNLFSLSGDNSDFIDNEIKTQVTIDEIGEKQLEKIEKLNEIEKSGVREALRAVFYKEVLFDKAEAYEKLVEKEKQGIQSYKISELKEKVKDDLIKKLEGKSDSLSLKFFKEYSIKYELIADNLPPYYYVRDILEVDKLKKVYFINLCYKLLVIEKNRIGKLTDKNQIKAFEKISKQSLEIIEKVVKDCVKESYIAENNGDSDTTGSGNRDKTLYKSKLSSMPNLEKYLTSYLPSKEEKKVQEKQNIKSKKEYKAILAKREEEELFEIRMELEAQERSKKLLAQDKVSKKRWYVNSRKGMITTPNSNRC